MKLRNQASIVTGGASGIGYHAGRALAAEGANVIVADFNLGWRRRTRRGVPAHAVVAGRLSLAAATSCSRGSRGV